MARPCRIFSRTRSDVYATLIECIECIAPSAVMHAGRVHTSAVHRTPPASAYQRCLICPLSMGCDHTVCAARSPTLN